MTVVTTTARDLKIRVLVYAVTWSRGTKVYGLLVVLFLDVAPPSAAKEFEFNLVA